MGLYDFMPVRNIFTNKVPQLIQHYHADQKSYHSQYLRKLKSISSYILVIQVGL